MIEVVAGLIEDGAGRVLACQRGEGAHLAGKWEFPGGKLEAGESPCVALVRELDEELGVEVEVTGRLSPVEWDYGRGPIRLIPLRCRLLGGSPHPHEHQALRWIRPAEAGSLDWAEADLPIVAEWVAADGDGGKEDGGGPGMRGDAQG